METTNQHVIHISHPNIINVYWNSQVQSQLTLVHQALCTGLHLVPLVGGCGVGLSGWVAGWPPFVTGHCSLAWPPFLFNVFLISPFSKRHIIKPTDLPQYDVCHDGQYCQKQSMQLTCYILCTVYLDLLHESLMLLLAQF